MSGNTVPDNLSLYIHIRGLWVDIHQNVRDGWKPHHKIEMVRRMIDAQPSLIESKLSHDYPNLNWEGDLELAIRHDGIMMDTLKNLEIQISEERQMWLQWYEFNMAHFSEIAKEGLKGLIIVNGAAILASLGVLSGQPSTHGIVVVLAAKIMLTVAFTSLAMGCGGHALAFERTSHVGQQVRGAVLAHGRHRRLRALSRYFRRHHNPVAATANRLIYGAMFLFAFGAAICAVMLWSA